jgi:hypothetical protein
LRSKKISQKEMVALNQIIAVVSGTDSFCLEQLWPGKVSQNIILIDTQAGSAILILEALHEKDFAD